MSKSKLSPARMELINEYHTLLEEKAELVDSKNLKFELIKATLRLEPDPDSSCTFPGRVLEVFRNNGCVANAAEELRNDTQKIAELDRKIDIVNHELQDLLNVERTRDALFTQIQLQQSLEQQAKAAQQAAESESTPEGDASKADESDDDRKNWRRQREF